MRNVVEHGFHRGALEGRAAVDCRNRGATRVGDRAETCVSVGPWVELICAVQLGVYPVDRGARRPCLPRHELSQISTWCGNRSRRRHFRTSRIRFHFCRSSPGSCRRCGPGPARDRAFFSHATHQRSRLVLLRARAPERSSTSPWDMRRQGSCSPMRTRSQYPNHRVARRKREVWERVHRWA